MPSQDVQGPAGGPILRAALFLWVAGMLVLSFLVGGQQIFERFPGLFGQRVIDTSRVMVNFLSEESSHRPPGK